MTLKNQEVEFIHLAQESDHQQALGNLKFTPMLIKLHITIMAYPSTWDKIVPMATEILTLTYL